MRELVAVSPPVLSVALVGVEAEDDKLRLDVH